MALLLTVWEVYSHSFFTLVRLKLGEWVEITLLARLLRQRGVLLLRQMLSFVRSIFSAPLVLTKEGLACLHAFI